MNFGLSKDNLCIKNIKKSQLILIFNHTDFVYGLKEENKLVVYLNYDFFCVKKLLRNYASKFFGGS